MARLAFPPTPTLSHFAASASTSAKPAARRSVSQRAPIQPAATRTKTRFARSSMIKLAASRTTLGAVSTAIQHTRLAHHVSTVASRTNTCAGLRALSVKISAHKGTANGEKKNLHLRTRIPGPKRTNETHAKLRQFVPAVYKTTAMDNNNEEGHGGLEAASERGDTVIEIDNNPDLLNDVSFDETLPRYEQSSLQNQLAKFQLLSRTICQGGQTAQCPAYGGAESFVLSRKRPRVHSEESVKQKVVPLSKIPRMTKTTLKYGVINLATAPPSFTVDQVKSDTRFGYASKSQSSQIAEEESSSVSKPPPSSTIDVVAPESKEPLVPLPVPCRKDVRFHEDKVQPRLFDCEQPPSNVNSVLEVEDGWTPLKLDRPYSGNSQAAGFQSMFRPASLQTIALKPAVLARFKAVQEYEKRCKEDSVAAGEHPALGQLSYGNADFKLALQPTKIITANDIGTFKDASELGTALKICSSLYRPVLHFGGFQDQFGRSLEDAQVPSGTAAAYKKPIDWEKAPIAEHRLANWVRTEFSAMQPADLAG